MDTTLESIKAGLGLPPIMEVPEGTPFVCLGHQNPKEIKTLLYNAFNKIYFAHNSSDYLPRASKAIMPSIRDVEVLNDCVVKVKFVDGSYEKAVLHKSDTFSLEQGISICLTKKLLSNFTNGNGSSAYNKLIKYALNTYEKNREAERKAIEEKERIERKQKKSAEKFRKMRERKAQREKEREIEIQKEAYLRAMKEFKEAKKD